MWFMGNLSGVYGERVGVASQEEKILSWFCVTLHLRHCWEEKTGNFTRVRQCRQLFVLEKNIKKSKWLYGKCSSEGRKFFPVWCFTKNILLRRGSIILISRGLRGGSSFKSEKNKILLKQTNWPATRHVIHGQPVRSQWEEGWSS